MREGEHDVCELIPEHSFKLVTSFVKGDDE